MTSRFSSSPTIETVKGWLDALGKKLEVAINYTERLYSVIVSRANYVRRKLRSLKHGRNQENFKALDWELRIHQHELSITSIQKENKQLQQKLKTSEENCQELKEKC